MADNQQLKAIITASTTGFTDALRQATSAVNGSTADWKTRLGEAQNSIRTAEGAIKNLADTARQMEAMHVDINGIPELASRIDDAGASLEALKANVGGAVDALARLRNEGSQLGINFVDYQRLSEAVKAAGQDMSVFAGGIRQMQSMIDGLANGVPDAVQAFGTLGISMEQLSSKSPIGQLETIADAINNITDPMQRADAANRMFRASLQSVLAVKAEYDKSVQSTSNKAYADDRDLARLVQMSGALEKLQASLAGVQAQAAQPSPPMELGDKIDDATAKVDDFAAAAKAMADEYVSALEREGAETEANVLKSSRAWDAYFVRLKRMYAELEEARKQAEATGNAPVAASAQDKKAELMLEQYRLLGREIQHVRAQAEKGFGLRTAQDEKAVDELAARMRALRELFASVDGRALSGAANEATASLNALRGYIRDGNIELDNMRREAERGIPVWRMMADGARSVARAIAHPTEAARSLWGEVKRCWDWMTRLKSSSQDAGSTTSTSLAMAVGMVVGMGSKLMVIVKGFRALGDVINTTVLSPLRDAYKETMRIASMRLDANRGMYGERARQWADARKELVAYYDLYKRSQEPDATNEDKERERQARRDLERKDIRLNPETVVMDNQVRDQIDRAQAEYVKALKGQLDELQTAADSMDRAMAEAARPETRLLYGSLANYEAAVQSIQAQQARIKDELAKVQDELTRAEKQQTPGEDFARMADAQYADQKAKWARDEQDALDKARDNAETEFKAGLDDLDRWAAETLESEAQRRIDALYDRYDRMLQQGVPEDIARPILEESLRQELRRQAERDAEAMKRLEDEYTDAAERLRQSQQREEDARKRLADAEKHLAEVRRKQADDEHLEDVRRRRERVQQRLSSFGFSLPRKWSPRESAAQRRERRRNNATDESIARKLERQRQGRTVNFTSREQERLREYRNLQRKESGLEAQEKALLAANRQMAASQALQSASASIKDAATALSNAAKTVAEDKEKSAAAQAKINEERTRQAEESKPAERSQRWSERQQTEPVRVETAQQEPPKAEAPATIPVAKPEPPKAEAPASTPVVQPEPVQMAPQQVPQVPGIPKAGFGTQYTFDKANRITDVDWTWPEASTEEMREAGERAKDQAIEIAGILYEMRKRMEALDAPAVQKEELPPVAPKPEMRDLPERLYAPPRVPGAEGIHQEQHDYTGLLEAIRVAIENNGKDTVKIV